jgi:hypothetical protein
MLTRRFHSLRLGARLAFSLFIAILTSLCSFSALGGADVPSVAFLGVRLINDNEGLDPTSDAERNRVAALEKQFTSALADSGQYTIVPVPDDIRVQIAKGQPIGACGGCDVAFGKQLGAERVAWVTVQKVSNLILNMNVYMADVATDKMTYIKSVDIRGNTDESWSRSMKYLLDNYLLAKEP